MTYSYEQIKPEVFKEEYQKTFLEVRDQIKEYLDISGAVTTLKAISGVGGDSYVLLAILDRLEEIGEIKKVYSGSVTQENVYVRG